MPGVIGAFDGLVVRVRKPHKTEADNPRAFWNRKVLGWNYCFCYALQQIKLCNRADVQGCYAVILQAVAGGNARILAASCQNPGSTHDSRAFRNCALGSRIYEGSGIAYRYFIIGDDAYANTDSLITPFPGKSYFTLLACSFFTGRILMWFCSYSGTNLDERKLNFNYKLSACRQVIERAFGIMVSFLS